MSKLYKVVFANNGKVNELYARKVSSSELFGFVVIENIEFENASSLVVDPSEERLREEFQNTRALHLPMHGVLRVEEVLQKGALKIRDLAATGNVTLFPSQPKRAE
jgi:hypothetical protein